MMTVEAQQQERNMFDWMLWIGQLDVMTDDTDMFITQRKVPV